MPMVLGWFAIAGSAVASLAQGVAGAYFLTSAATAPVPVQGDVPSALSDARPSVPVLARIMRAGALMRGDLEGTV